MKKLLLTLLICCLLSHVQGQNKEDKEFIKRIYDLALSEGLSYQMLEHLCLNIGPRLSGSPQAAQAVNYTHAIMDSLNFDKVFLQEVMVPHWIRGGEEFGKIILPGGKEIQIRPLALGNSVGTGKNGVEGEVLIVNTLEEVRNMELSKVKGKIVFYNRPMDPSNTDTFNEYGRTVDQRALGPSVAAAKGARAVMIRSVTTAHDNHAHTGSLRYSEGNPKIPAFALSADEADILALTIRANPDAKIYFENYAEMLPDALSHNVIGQLNGDTDQYIVVSGHLDSWDVGHGAHDDGAGCVQAIEAVRILKALGYKPKNNIRAVMYMNEENGLRGGTIYADSAKKLNERHIAAIESDRGGFTPRGFTSTMDDDKRNKVIENWVPLLSEYGLFDFSKRGGGADIGPLAAQGTILFGYLPDDERYFDYHHSSSDTFDEVNRRELEMGAAAMASLIYLIDKYGF